MCGTESISSMAPKIWSLVPQEMKNCQSLYCFKERYEEMETKLSMSVMQNLLAKCWFFIMKMCGIWRITFLFVLLICYFIYMLYNICIFFFFYIFPHWKAELKTRGLLIYQINEFANHFVSQLCRVFFGERERLRVISFFIIIKSYVKGSFKVRIVITIIIQISYQLAFVRKIKVKLQLQWTSFSQMIQRFHEWS